MTREADSPPPPAAAVVSVGDELLLGQTVDTDGSWLAQQLSRLGLRVLRRWVVGGVPEEIRQVVQSALELAEVVLVTGGLG
ncbi:MAG: damage-inducible protein CinA, partial [Gemmatimonadetes bacterium]|nr:damage-inducible protein CinA [Gemmatimonadota bacterium]